MNIVILGPAGSGKSTLAIKLAQKYKLRHIELDSFKYLENWQPVEKVVMRNEVRQHTTKNGWVIDGNYISTFGRELIDKANVVIWLDYPFPFILQRLLRRTLKRTITKQELWHGNHESFYNNFFTKNSVVRHLFYTWKRQRSFYLELFSDETLLKSKKMIRARHPNELTLLQF